MSDEKGLCFYERLHNNFLMFGITITDESLTIKPRTCIRGGTGQF